MMGVEGVVVTAVVVSCVVLCSDAAGTKMAAGGVVRISACARWTRLDPLSAFRLRFDTNPRPRGVG